MFRNLRRFACAGLLGIAGLGLAGSSAEAGYGYGYGYAPRCYYKTVVTYNYVQEPYYEWVIAYDAYGCPFKVQKTFYRTVTVPVTSLVKVCY